MSLKNISDCIISNCPVLTTVDACDRMILQGVGFVSNNVISELAPEAIIRNRIHSSSTKYTHFKSLLISAEGATLQIKILRNVTVDNVGTLVPNVYKQMNHNSSNTSTTTGYINSTYSAAEVFKTIILHGNTTPLSTAGTGFSEIAYDDLICKKDEDYFLEIENLSSADTARYINIIATIFELDYGLEV